MAGEDAAELLAALRGEIDRIDADMHGLLMQRGAIIDRLIAAKPAAAGGSAFRPEREAAMMRVLAARHGGRLPVEAIEGIWRVIISTFTYVQAPFGVHSDLALGAAAMRDTARFHFGFTVPYEAHASVGAVIAALAASRGDLGLVGLHAAPETAWWRTLEAPDAPKVIARLPFSSRPGHPAATPALVLSKSISGEGAGAVLLHSANPGPLDPPLRAALARHGVQVEAATAEAAMLSGPRALDASAIAGIVRSCGRAPGAVAFVGSHPAQAAGT